jgi:protein-S-isoprenylcysteine O-methyltransferase Ste14
MGETLKIIEYLWLAVLAVWLLGRFTAKRAKQRESPVAYLGRIFILVVLFEFLLNPRLGVGWLGSRMVPASRVVDLAAVAITAAGVALAIWARLCLGGNWSGTVTLKESHELIRRGPYARIRHPIYTGFDLAFAGTALAVGQWRGAVAFAFVLVLHALKARKEEAWLAKEFGADFEQHRRRTGMFLPRLLPR